LFWLEAFGKSFTKTSFWEKLYQNKLLGKALPKQAFGKSFTKTYSGILTRYKHTNC